MMDKLTLKNGTTMKNLFLRIDEERTEILVLEAAYIMNELERRGVSESCTMAFETKLDRINLAKTVVRAYMAGERKDKVRKVQDGRNRKLRGTRPSEQKE